MAIINSEFEFNNPRPNFKRDQYKTLVEMKNVPLTAVDRGHKSFCEEDGNTYEFANDLGVDGNPKFDATLGYWRIWKTGGLSDVDKKQIDDNTQAIQNLFSVTILNKLTLGQYMEMKNKNELQNCFYSIYKNDELFRVYLGTTLIMKKAENGEQPTIGGVFPMVFPIIFA